MSDETNKNQPQSIKQNPQSPQPSPPQKVPISWVLLGIGAIVIMWALSSWLFR